MLYMMLADGFEETEAVAALDIIRRAEIDIKTVGIGGRSILGAHKITVLADLEISETDFSDISGIILPGGMPGTLNLEKNEKVRELILECDKENKLIAAICAAPSILGNMGLLNGKRVTCFPGFEDTLTGAKVSDDLVCRDKNVITGKGAGAALCFGAEIADYFKEGKGKKLLKQVQSI